MRRVVLHPFLVSTYFVVFLFAQNLNEAVTLGTVLRPLLFVLACTGVLFGLLCIAFRSPHRGGVLTSLLVLLSFSFGHVRNAFSVGGNLLLVMWALLAVGATAGTMKAPQKLPRLTMALNILVLALVILNIIPVATHLARPRVERPEPAAYLELPAAASIDPAAKRDIYYIIFDRYGNEEALRRRVGFDNGAMMRYLERQGFYVARHSAANHLKTGESLASSLNMTYLNYLADLYGPDYADFNAVYEMLEGSKVSRYLQSIGYRYHQAGPWWDPTEEDPSADVNHTHRGMSDFSVALLDTSLPGYLIDLFGLRGPQTLEAAQIERTPYQVEQLKTVPDDPAPTFTFAHFTLPHDPYVFDEDGELLTQEQRKAPRDELFIGQLKYTNKLMKELVEVLLAGPEESDPIIVFQADEGPHPRRLEELGDDDFDWTEASTDELRQKLLILNAYYLPGVDHDALYPTISPVNTFRLIFNLYFDADLPLLEDRSYIFKDVDHIFRFSEVTHRLR